MAPLHVHQNADGIVFDSHKGGAILRLLYTMTQPAQPERMCVMRTMLIVATVAMAALRIMWHAFSPSDPLGSGEEWTADE
jgi:hypothetical protein